MARRNPNHQVIRARRRETYAGISLLAIALLLFAPFLSFARSMENTTTGRPAHPRGESSLAPAPEFGPLERGLPASFLQKPTETTTHSNLIPVFPHLVVVPRVSGPVPFAERFTNPTRDLFIETSLRTIYCVWQI